MKGLLLLGRVLSYGVLGGACVYYIYLDRQNRKHIIRLKNNQEELKKYKVSAEKKFKEAQVMAERYEELARSYNVVANRLKQAEMQLVQAREEIRQEATQASEEIALRQALEQERQKNAKLSNEMAAINQKIMQLEAQNKQLQQEVYEDSKAKSILADKERENIYLREQLNKALEKNSYLEQSYTKLQQESSAPKVVNIPTHSVATKPQIVQPVENKVVQDKKVESSKVSIQSFSLPPQEKLLFVGDIAQVEAEMKSVQDVTALIQYLTNSEYKEAPTFLRIIEKYEKELKKAFDKVDLENEDEEEISGIVASRYATVLERYFLEKLMVAIYRGMKSTQDAFYESLLKEVNAYLTKSGVYTREVVVGNTTKEEDYSDMKIFPRKTEDAKKHNRIEEVEMLPYYINYMNDLEEFDQIAIRGEMIVLSNKLK